MNEPTLTDRLAERTLAIAKRNEKLRVIAQLFDVLYKCNAIDGVWALGGAPQPIKHEYGDGTCDDPACCKQMTEVRPFYAVEIACKAAIRAFFEKEEQLLDEREVDYMTERVWTDYIEIGPDDVLRVIDQVLAERHVNVYEVDRRYGGPEEGGWWYDEGTKVESRLTDVAHVDDVVAELAEEYPPNRGKRIGTPDYKIMIENAPAADYPKHRPVYC